MSTATEINKASVSVAVAALAGNLVCSAPVVTATFGTFLIPVTTEFGWSRSAFAMTLTIVSLIGVFMFPIAGGIADRYGARPVVIVGNVVFAASVALLAFAGDHLALFYAGYALVAVTSVFTSTVVLSRVVSAWFARTRGLFLGLTAGIGNGMGCAIMPILTMHVIADHGWRNGYLALAACVVLIGLPFFVTMFRQPNQLTPSRPGGGDVTTAIGLDTSEARRTGLFWTILVAISLGGGALSAIFTHVVPLLTDRHMGASATTIIMAIALSSTVWQITLGRLLDTAKMPRFSAICIFISAAGVFLLYRANSPPTMLVAAIMIGVGNGSEYALLSYIVPRYFGLRAYSEIYGSILGIVILCMGAMPAMMDLVFDRVGNYGPALIGLSVTLAVTAILILRFPAYRYTREGEAIPETDGAISGRAAVTA